MKNQLLNENGLPNFKHVNVTILSSSIEEILVKNKQKITNLLQTSQEIQYSTLIESLEEMHEALHSVWTILDHLNSVANTEEISKIHDDLLVKITEFQAEMLQNKYLYLSVLSIYEEPSFHSLTIPKKKVIMNLLKDFKLSGVDLSAENQEKLKNLEKRLAECQSKFEKNVLDATNAWEMLVEEEGELTGLPEYFLRSFHQAANAKGHDGWLVTLDFPSYYAVMTSADNRHLRQKVYEAYITRASELGDKRFDNTEWIYEILNTRYQIATLLGFNHFAEYSLDRKMVKDPKKVFSFLYDLAENVRDMAQKEMFELKTFAQKTDGVSDIQPWDIAYYSEKLCQQECGVSQEVLREYFPINKVLEGLFVLLGKLYGISVKKVENVVAWHADVQLFEVIDVEKKVRGYCYLDLYARPQKRNGAWMLNGQNRMHRQDGSIQLPLAYIVTNFSKPLDGQPALLTHDEVLTLFHEFGHAFHQVLTIIDYPSISGCNGVEWDAIELPSQFMEYWCWEEKILPIISEHYRTQEALPLSLLNGIKKSKNFQIGMQILRQIEFSLFDFELHVLSKFDQESNTVQKILNQVREKVSVTPVIPSNRFQHTFSHIFGGGYAAGYYSYKWAEVLASDVYGRFEEQGLLNPKIGHDFLVTFLEQGGSKGAMELFQEFREREPSVQAFLQHNGLNSGV